MKKIIALTICLCVLSACKKEPLWEKKIESDINALRGIRPNPSFLTGAGATAGTSQCINDSDHPVQSSSPFTTPIFHDDFSTSKDPACYTIKPKCLIRGDWSMPGDCPFDETLPRYSGLKKLDKCTWRVWHDGSSMSNVVTMADGVEVSYSSDVGRNTLKLKMVPNPDYNPSKGQCGTIDSTQPGNYNMNCPLIAGAVDSNYVDSQHHGQNALYGRIEMTARFLTTTSNASYPALWMWPEKLGDGYPLTATAAEQVPHGSYFEPKHIGELDILESNGRSDKDYAFQSYHQWDTSNSNAFVTRGRVVHMSDWHIYGVEWTNGYLKFYIDGCYTYQINRNDKSNYGNTGIPLSISDTASFMMMTLATDGGAVDPNNRDIFEIKDVTVFK